MTTTLPENHPHQGQIVHLQQSVSSLYKTEVSNQYDLTSIKPNSKKSFSLNHDRNTEDSIVCQDDILSCMNFNTTDYDRYN